MFLDFWDGREPTPEEKAQVKEAEAIVADLSEATADDFEQMKKQIEEAGNGTQAGKL